MLKQVEAGREAQAVSASVSRRPSSMCPLISHVPLVLVER